MAKKKSNAEETQAKARIFGSATSLFARKGFAQVTTREIAKNADANLSLINYYYGGKVGILKEIVNECYDKYFAAIRDSDEKAASPQERLRLIARGLVKFFRENTELAMVGLNVLPIDLPEIIDLKVKWVTENRDVTKGLFRQLGVDMEDVIQMHVFRGLLTTIVNSHFQSMYAWKHVLEAAAKSEKKPEWLTDEPEEKLDDAFYEKYSDMLVQLYLNGLTGITGKVTSIRGVKDEKQDSQG
jgi:AcrR family transcriptional regulator